MNEDGTKMASIVVARVIPIVLAAIVVYSTWSFTSPLCGKDPSLDPI